MNQGLTCDHMITDQALAPFFCISNCRLIHYSSFDPIFIINDGGKMRIDKERPRPQSDYRSRHLYVSELAPADTPDFKKG